MKSNRGPDTAGCYRYYDIDKLLLSENIFYIKGREVMSITKNVTVERSHNDIIIWFGSSGVKLAGSDAKRLASQIDDLYDDICADGCGIQLHSPDSDPTLRPGD